MPVIGWLALLVCLWTTGDLVVDLAFEVPEVISDAGVSSEAPDNAAEHLLMPSAQADRLTAGSLAATPAADFDASSIVVATAGNAASRAAPPLGYPPRNKPVSLSSPLRI